eukprot:COSAG01_NODE_11639_length_1891_cov_2.475446_2_plen_84_part_00
MKGGGGGGGGGIMTGFCAVFHPQSEHFEQAWAVLAGKSDSSGRLPVSPSQWSGADIEHVWGGAQPVRAGHVGGRGRRERRERR